MMNRAKVFCLKLLFCVTAMTFCASSPVQAEGSSNKTKPPPIFNLPKTDDDAGKKMKSTSFKSHEQEKKEEAKEEEEAKPALEDIEEADFDESAESIAEKEKSPEQKLWDKYKALKENAKKEEKKDKKSASKSKKKDSKKVDDEDQEGENNLSDTEEESAGEKKKSTGIAGIIEDYKKAQQDKGSLNTRSFGKID